jgi:hypothetical protein
MDASVARGALAAVVLVACQGCGDETEWPASLEGSWTLVEMRLGDTVKTGAIGTMVLRDDLSGNVSFNHEDYAVFWREGIAVGYVVEWFHTSEFTDALSPFITFYCELGEASLTCGTYGGEDWVWERL